MHDAAQEERALTVEARFHGDLMRSWLLAPGETICLGSALPSAPPAHLACEAGARVRLDVAPGVLYRVLDRHGDVFRQPAWIITRGEQLALSLERRLELQLGPWSLRLVPTAPVARLASARGWRRGRWPVAGLVGALVVHLVLGTLAAAMPAPKLWIEVVEAGALTDEPIASCNGLCCSRPACIPEDRAGCAADNDRRLLCILSYLARLRSLFDPAPTLGQRRDPCAKMNPVARQIFCTIPAELAARSAPQWSDRERIGASPLFVRMRGPLDRALVSRVVRRNFGKVRACVVPPLSWRRAPRRQVVVRFVIGPTGEVTAAEIERSDLGRSRTTQCLLGAFRHMRFPRPQGGGNVVVSYPLRFD